MANCRFPLNIVVILFLCYLLSCTSILRSSRELKLPPKTVILTFDDGPNSTFGTTDSLLAVLKRHDVHAYFCLIGVNVLSHPEIVRRIVEDGHVLVDHGFDDQPIVTLDAAAIERNIVRWDSVVKEALGPLYTPATLYRPPYGIYPLTLNRILRKHQSSLLPVSFYALDAETGPAGQARVIASTISKVKNTNGAIIVLHDGKASQATLTRKLASDSLGPYNRRWIPEATDSIITILKSAGYRFDLP